MSMRILAIETATEACSAALYVGNQSVAWTKAVGRVQDPGHADALPELQLDVNDQYISEYEICPREHAVKILPMVQRLLSQAEISLSQLDAIAFGCGPGAFTGVRIATAVAQGLAYGAHRPLIPISTLAALARGACRQHAADHVAVAIDARLQQVYWGSYACMPDGDMALCLPERVCAPEQVELPSIETTWWAAGSGFSAYADTLRKILASHRMSFEQVTSFPHAEDVAYLARFALSKGKICDPMHAIPVYLRDEVVARTSLP